MGQHASRQRPGKGLAGSSAATTIVAVAVERGGGVRSGRVCCIPVSWSICRAIKRSELKRSNILDLSMVVCDIVGILLKSLQKG